MRTVSEIIVAAQEQQPATDEELRHTLLVLYYALLMCCPSDFEGKTRDHLEFRAKNNFDLRFRLMRNTPTHYLGDRYTPGTPENDAGRAQSKAVLAGFEKRKKQK